MHFTVFDLNASIRFTSVSLCINFPPISSRKTEFCTESGKAQNIQSRRLLNLHIRYITDMHISIFCNKVQQCGRRGLQVTGASYIRGYIYAAIKAVLISFCVNQCLVCTFILGRGSYYSCRRYFFCIAITISGPKVNFWISELFVLRRSVFNVNS